VAWAVGHLQRRPHLGRRLLALLCTVSYLNTAASEHHTGSA
jgi:hypothetical protein